jgi:hypothetical protein
MKISATVVQPIFVEVECDDHTSPSRIRELVLMEAEKNAIDNFSNPEITSCIKINEQCPEEDEEISEVLG